MGLHQCARQHLPKYRGAAPIHRSILAGDKESGVTIMKMALELDAGEIYSVAKTPISEDMTTESLQNAWPILDRKLFGKCSKPWKPGMLKRFLKMPLRRPMLKSVARRSGSELESTK